MRNALLAGTFDRARPAGSSATSSCCARRCLRATRSAMSPSPARWRPRPSESTSASASSPPRSWPGSAWAPRRARSRRRRHDRHRLRLGPRARRALPRDLHDERECEQRHCGGTRSLRLDLRAQPRGCPDRGRGLARRRSSPRWRSPGRCSSLRSTRRSRSHEAVPVRLLGLVFLAILGVVAAEATQAVGALLLLGLVAAPAAAAHRLGRTPYEGMALSALLAVACVWAGLGLSYVVTQLPPSTAIISVATALYVLAAGASTLGQALRPVR